MGDQRKDHPDSERLRKKRAAPNNYRSITCVPMMWKILTVQIWEIYYSLINRGLFPEEQKGFHKGSRGIGGLLYIHQHIINESKTREKIYDVDLRQKWL